MKKLGYFLVIAALMAANFAAETASPTGLLYQKNGSVNYNELAWSVAGAGDVNGDGRADFIVGALVADPGGRVDAGSAFVYSGVDGSLLFQKNGAAAGDLFGKSVAGAGDVNGDGQADFIIGAPADYGTRIGSAYVYSGVDGSLLFQKNGISNGEVLGWLVGGAGDVNGDGRADFIIGSPGTSPGGVYAAGSAFVYSGADGTLLFQKDGGASYDLLGWSVAITGDVNGDGKADFLIGALLADPGGSDDAGSVYLYSGADGSLLFQKDGVAAGGQLGRSLAGVEDINGDGRADFIIGAPYASPNYYAGSAYVYSGADGSLLFQKDGAHSGDDFASSVAAAGDWNGDGKSDFIIGAPETQQDGLDGAGSAYVYSGADGSLLFQKNGSTYGEVLGWSVAGAGDVNGDGKADVIIGAPETDPGGLLDAGSAFVYAGCSAAKGDMNADGNFTAADVVSLVGCVFQESSACFFCVSDANCDGSLTAADIVAELGAVFSGIPFPCS